MEPEKISVHVMYMKFMKVSMMMIAQWKTLHNRSSHCFMLEKIIETLGVIQVCTKTHKN